MDRPGASVYTLIAKRFLAPVLDSCRGTRTMRCLKELEQSQWWPRYRILELQNERLRQLVQYAYDRVPYYRRIFDESALKVSDIECVQDLVKLPVLTRRLIRDNFDDIAAPGFPSKEVIPNSTGGSSGEPLEFYSTRDDYYNWGYAASLRAHSWAGYELGDKLVVFRAIRPYRSKMERFMEIPRRFFSRTLIIGAKEMSSERLLLLARKLEDFQPAIIRGYPSAIYLLAQLIEREGKPRLRPRAIIVHSEQVYDYQRELFTKVFRCQTYSHYATWEIHPIASECSEHSGYHIAAENVIVEIVDDEGKPVPVGGEGRTLITNLHNYAMPFIRYDNGDVGALSDKACPCGRGLPLLAKLTGRATDFIRTKSGMVVPGLALHVPWYSFPSLGIEQFQIVQETYGDVVLKLVAGREYPKERKDEIAREIIDIYRSRFGEDLDITIEFVDQIPTTKDGKRRVVISNLPEGAGEKFCP